MSLQHLPRRPAHPLRPMPLRKHAQLPQRTPKRIRHLRVVDVRAVHAVPRAVLGREQRLELRVALDEGRDEGERARGGTRWPVQRGGEEALRERGGAPGGGRRGGGARGERELERAEEDVGGGLWGRAADARRSCVRVGSRDRGRGGLDVGHERELGQEGVEAVDEVAEINVECFACGEAQVPRGIVSSARGDITVDGRQ